MARATRRLQAVPQPRDGFAAPSQVTISVTAADIRHGEKQSECNCPVARAAARLVSVPRTELWVSVGKNTVGIAFPQGPDELISYDLPLSARRFIAKFDASGLRDFSPFTFTAKLHLGEIADGEY